MYITHEIVIKEMMICLFLIGSLKTSQPTITISNNKCSTIERTTN
ncbi:Mycothiol synthase [Bacillus cereus Rock4-18]|nr:Mycothiol synthase [Bacillus cereus Rock4-18]